MSDSPTLACVLAHFAPGRVVRIRMTPRQRHALRDPDGKIALDVLRHVLGMRAACSEGRPPERFPVTQEAFQGVARLLGYTTGQKKSRSLVSRLKEAGVIEDAGSYRQPYRNSGTRSGFRVSLYRLACKLRPLKKQRPVGRHRSVKTKAPPRWWAHPLFGDLSGLPPPHLSRRAAARMLSQDELLRGCQRGMR